MGELARSPAGPVPLSPHLRYVRKYTGNVSLNQAVSRTARAPPPSRILALEEPLLARSELTPDALETGEIYRVEELRTVWKLGQDLGPERFDLDLDIDRWHVGVEDERNDPVGRAAEFIGTPTVCEPARGGVEQLPFEIPVVPGNGTTSIEDC